VSTGLAAFADEVAMHLDHRCSVAGHRMPGAVGTLPVPPVRQARVDVSGKDFE
jgi:hypothetical protein